MVKDLREDNQEILFAILWIPSSSIGLFDKNIWRVSNEDNIETAVPILIISKKPILLAERLRERF